VKAVRVILVLAGLAVVFLFESPRAFAQSEIAPDHFEAQPFQQAKASAAKVTHYNGSFRLPYAVQCNGKNLSPGNYSLSFTSRGNVGRITLKQKGEAIEVTGVLYKQAHNEGRNVLFVESNGETRRLSAIHVAELDLVFDPNRPAEQARTAKKIRVERLPLS